MCQKTDKLARLDPEQRAKLDMRARLHVVNIADEGARERARQDFVDRELARTDEAHGPFAWDPMTLERGRSIENTYAGDLTELRAQIAAAARSASAWISDPAAREAAIAKYVANELGRRGIKS